MLDDRDKETLAESHLLNPIQIRLETIDAGLQDIRVSVESVRMIAQTFSQRVDDHEDRLRTAERWQQRLSPLVSMLTFVCGVLAAAVVQSLVR